jgi:predicted nucleotidyltransferase component of viral defense system
MLNDVFVKQARLLLRVLPHVMTQKEFALKGGTAINLFVRQMPRLSVDIDLVYVPMEGRETSLDTIHSCLTNAARKIKLFVDGTRVIPRKDDKNRMVSFVVRTSDALVKVEPNLVIRGAVFPCEKREVTLRTEEALGVEQYMKVQTLSFADLYGGKICAALDRHHPRDLFDIKVLLDHEGLSKPIRQAFLVYLVSHNRPMSELLDPAPIPLKEFQSVFKNDLWGMVNSLAPYEDSDGDLQAEHTGDTSPRSLLRARETLLGWLHENITKDEKNFLVSFKNGSPQWELLGVPGVEKLPAPQWKLRNISKMSPEKRIQAFRKLKRVLKI